MPIMTAMDRARSLLAVEPGEPAGAREEALTAMKVTLLDSWGLDPGDPATVGGLLVGSLLAYGSACAALTAGDLAQRTYGVYRERAARTLLLHDGLIALERDIRP